MNTITSEAIICLTSICKTKQNNKKIPQTPQKPFPLPTNTPLGTDTHISELWHESNQMVSIASEKYSPH